VQDAGPKPEPVPDVDERGATNVAFLQDTSPNASSCIPGYADRHSIAFLNDGWYNNPRSWIADGNPPAWIEINLGKVYTVDKVVFGSEHTHAGRIEPYRSLECLWLLNITQTPKRQLGKKPSNIKVILCVIQPIRVQTCRGKMG